MAEVVELSAGPQRRPSPSRCEVTIAAASLTTGNADRDAHLRSAGFLGVAEFPHLTFRSTGVRRGAGDRWWVDGLLTIRDIEHPVALDTFYAGSGPDPWGGTRAAFVASTQLDRRDFEMNWNMGLPGGMLLVGSSLRGDLNVQAVLAQQRSAAFRISNRRHRAGRGGDECTTHPRIGVNYGSTRHRGGP